MPTWPAWGAARPSMSCASAGSRVPVLVIAHSLRPRQHWGPWQNSFPSRPHGMLRKSVPSSRMTWMSAPSPPVSLSVTPSALAMLSWFSWTRMSWLAAGSADRQYCGWRLHQVGPCITSSTVAASMSNTIRP